MGSGCNALSQKLSGTRECNIHQISHFKTSRLDACYAESSMEKCGMSRYSGEAMNIIFLGTIACHFRRTLYLPKESYCLERRL